jgi:aspartyl-tRNA(Asn)/glutamyl-tRNA(Gln) amidotransferase subunit A
LQLTGRIMAAEAYAIVGHLVDDPSVPLDEHVRPRIAAGREISAKAYLDALSERERMKRDIAAALSGIDALLTPTTRTPAIPIDEVDQTSSPAHFTRFANFFDLCALSIPNGATPDGLPTGLQVNCAGYDEATALRIGWAFENATEWHLRRPME